MNQERYIAALEISSSKIIGAVGVYTGEGQLTVLAIEQEESNESVRYGIIQNLEEVSLRTKRIIDKLERHAAVAPRRISGIFIGLSGRSMRSVPAEVRLNFPEEVEITDDILDRLRNDARNTAIDTTLEIVDVVPRKYIIDKIETTPPKGSIGRSITAIYDIIVCRPELKRNITRAIPDRCEIRNNGFVVTPLAAAHVILPAEEKRLGCMLVDFGAETTTVSIFRKGSLQYFATLPLGSRNITRDITTLNLLEEMAEEIKCTSGNAIARETPSTLNINGVRLSDVSNLIVARAEEIAANVVQQIEYAGLTRKDLPAGIICIGGGAKLDGMLELLENQSGLNARLAHLPEYIHVADARANRQEAIQVNSLLYEAAVQSRSECLEDPAPQELPATGTADDIQEDLPPARRHTTRKNNAGKIAEGARNFFSRLFARPDDDEDSSELD